ncbi:hypothetical protein QAD02_003274 [Eretmocerus hayati]|uniref:Uncharacterized protein n=1 Tax=Eretmocerus hayati TaxID=131215 RepID=A0ACC2NR41_9HYME|nr:hypothetical protein QAD02_003274 [Eretmocerus hayati]
MDPGEFKGPRTPPKLQRSSTPPRPTTRRDAGTSRGTAPVAPTPDGFHEPALIIALPCLPPSERCDLEDALELELRQNWDPKLGWQGYLDRRDEAAKALRPNQPVQYSQPYRGKQSRSFSEWTPEIDLQIRRVRSREYRRAMELVYELLFARVRESVQNRNPGRRPVVQPEPMLRPHLDSKRRRRNPNRQITVKDHADHPRHVERDDSPVLKPHNLAEGRPSPPADEAFQEEVRDLAEEAARTAPMGIERVRGQPNQSSAVSQPLSTPPPSASARRQNERGSSWSPIPPPPRSATKDTGGPVRILRRPHRLPPVRDNGTEGTTTLPRPFPVLPQVRCFETPAAEQPGVELV